MLQLQLQLQPLSVPDVSLPTPSVRALFLCPTPFPLSATTGRPSLPSYARCRRCLPTPGSQVFFGPFAGGEHDQRRESFPDRAVPPPVQQMARIKPKQLLIQSKTKKAPSRISYSTIITWNLIVILVVLSLYATYSHWHQRSAQDFEMELHEAELAVRPVDPKMISRPRYAVMNTAKGPITIEIYKDASAGVVDRFIDLCKSNHFKGMPFRHIIKNFVIQGGDFDFDGAAQEWITKAKASGKNDLSPKHEAFMIGTAKNPNNKGFDLFITTAPIPDLNDKLVVFGRVIKGEDIVQEIEEVDTDEHYQPKAAIGIINIMLKQEP